MIASASEEFLGDGMDIVYVPKPIKGVCGVCGHGWAGHFITFDGVDGGCTETDFSRETCYCEGYMEA